MDKKIESITKKQIEKLIFDVYPELKGNHDFRFSQNRPMSFDEKMALLNEHRIGYKISHVVSESTGEVFHDIP